MNDAIPLPENVRKVVQRHEKPGEMHPGLFLDKFVPSHAGAGGNRSSKEDTKWQEKVQLPAVKKVVELSEQEPLGLEFKTARDRWTHMLDALKSRRFTAETTGPLTLHLARASALENAGICLHPLYGFTYLPGTGLKGMAHAYATQVWLAGQADKDEAWNEIRAVFGSGASPLLKKIAEDLDVSVPGDSHAGSVIFHDAWPVTWPRLTTDIVNCHHPEYYQSQGSQAKPPGDWENPIPVYFLAVPAGQQFEFALAPRPRREEVPDEHVQLARQWLLGALCHLGAGAKTNAGYGGFKPVDGARPAMHSDVYQDFEATVELVTPAFLAGADQKAHDCELRPATLRGLLRWWWRTMHAGHVDPATLREMETLVWGDAQHGGPIRIEITAARNVEKVPVPGKALATTRQGKPKLEGDKAFFNRNSLAPAPKSTTQGLFYASFGTDDMVSQDGEKRRKTRYCVKEGASWNIRIVARSGQCGVKDRGGNKATGGIAPDEILLQAQAALWLLCQFGGVGSKSRKGFGSLQVTKSELEWSLQKVQAVATQFRSHVQNVLPSYQAGSTGTAALEKARCLHVEKPTPWTNSWFALDQVGAAAQEFAQANPRTGHGKHCRAKVALGLPRKLHGPLNRPLRHQNADTWQRQVDLEGPNGNRHSSPVCYHLAKDEQGRFIVRAAIFLTDYLWDKEKGRSRGLKESHDTLSKLGEHLKHSLEQRVQEQARAGSKPPFYGETVATQGRAAGRSTGGSEKQQRAVIPNPNDWVTAELLEEKTKKGGWKAKHTGSGLSGPVVNSQEVPEEKQPGERVELVVQSANQKQIMFRWPTDRDKEKGSSPSTRGPKGPRKKGGGRR